MNNTRKIYLIILLNVIIVSVVLSLQMVEGKKDNILEYSMEQLEEMSSSEVSETFGIENVTGLYLDHDLDVNKLMKMVHADDEDEADDLYSQYGEYGYFACYDTDTNTTTYYDQRVSENCVMIGDGK